MFCISIVSACKNLKKMLPEGPAFSIRKQKEIENAAAHKVNYTSAPLTTLPIIPFQVWGLTYDLDIILVSKNDRWNMHEFALVKLKDREIWLMKDALEGPLDQFVVADIEDINNWLPELPIQRKSYPLKIKDHSDDKNIDLEFEYENHFGEKINASYQGKYPKTKQSKRNGSTFGHSKNHLLVALDLPLRDFGKKARISYDNKFYKMDKLLGIVPFQMAVFQTQGGLSTAEYQIKSINNSFRFNYISGGENLFIKTVDKDLVQYESEDEFRKLQYSFVNHCFTGAVVQQKEKSSITTSFSVYPALPDLSRRFDGRYSSTFILEINGGNRNALGTIDCYWVEDILMVEVIPEKPWWVADRPMISKIKIQEDNVGVSIQMK